MARVEHTFDGIKFHVEWQRRVFAPDGMYIEKLTSNWYDDQAIVWEMLNPEYPDPTPTGFTYKMIARWVSEEAPNGFGGTPNFGASPNEDEYEMKHDPLWDERNI